MPLNHPFLLDPASPPFLHKAIGSAVLAQSRVVPTPEDWEHHRLLIKRLYVDENKKLGEVAEILAAQHGHVATPRMYKDRIKKWKLEKKNKESDMIAILRKHIERTAVGKQTSFKVRGQAVDLDRVLHYFKRKRRIRDPETYSAPTPSDVTYRTPSPMPPEDSSEESMTRVDTADPSSSSARSSPNDTFMFSCSTNDSVTPSVEIPENESLISFSKVQKAPRFPLTNWNNGYLRSGTNTVFDGPVPRCNRGGGSPVCGRYGLYHGYNTFLDAARVFHSSTSPQNLRIPESLLLTIKTYLDGAFERGTRITDACGNYTIVDQFGHELFESPTKFQILIYTALNMLANGSTVEFRRILSKAFNLLKDLVRSEQPRTFCNLLGAFIFLTRKGRSDIVKLLRDYVYQLTINIHGKDHPWTHFLRLIGSLEEESIEFAVLQAWKCFLDSFDRAIGPFHQSSLNANLEYIARVHGSVNRIEEERLLRQLISRCEDVSSTPNLQTLDITIHLGWNLLQQRRLTEAEELGSTVLSQSEDLEAYPEKVRALELLAESQYRQDKRSLAEANQRLAGVMIVEKYGKNDAWALENTNELERWLRIWGRGDEANKLKIEMEAIGKDEVDE